MGHGGLGKFESEPGLKKKSAPGEKPEPIQIYYRTGCRNTIESPEVPSYLTKTG
jgi:hypothetical protein